MKKVPDTEKIIEHWISASDKDFKTMNNLYKSKDYHWSLFMGHLVVEKLLKACVVKNTKQHAPFTHDLLRLATVAGIETDVLKKDCLDVLTTFNMNARYDTYKLEFYKKCTADYTAQWIKNIKELRIWIKSTQLK